MERRPGETQTCHQSGQYTETPYLFVTCNVSHALDGGAREKLESAGYSETQNSEPTGGRVSRNLVTGWQRASTECRQARPGRRT